MRRVLLVVLLALAPVAASADEPSVQEVLLRAKPAVALVVAEVASRVTLRCAGGGETTETPAPLHETGTAWFISASGWAITNAHVVSAAHRPGESLKAQQAQKAARPGCRAAAVTLDPSISVILSNGLRLPATVAKYSPPVAGEAMSGRDLALLRLEAADLPSLWLGDSSTVRIGDPLHILGFPGVVLSHELLNASAKAEASVTNGAVSGFKQDRAGQTVIQTDAAVAWGNSGGPAVNRRGEVSGVLTFVALSGGEAAFVQGFNFVIPAQAVREFLEGTPVPLAEPSRFNRAWHAALSSFFAGEHRRAEAAFAEANRLMPDLPDVRRLSQENQERIKNPPPRPLPWAMIAIAVTTVSLGAYAGLLGARWKRNRFRVRPAEVLRLLEAQHPPLILDVRDEATYAKSPVRIPRSQHITPQALEAGAAKLDVQPDRTVVAYCT